MRLKWPTNEPKISYKQTTRSDDEGDEGTQPANINELFDYALELLWSLVTKNGWDQTKLPDISEGFSYVSMAIAGIFDVLSYVVVWCDGDYHGNQKVLYLHLYW